MDLFYVHISISFLLCVSFFRKKPQKHYISEALQERRRPDLNRWILVLQTIALPLGYCAMLYNYNKSINYSQSILICNLSHLMTPTGIEPVLPPWKGDVLTAWPWSRVLSPLGVSNVSDKKTPRVGLEPTTTRLTAECSTIELSRKISCFISYLRECCAFSKSYKAKCEEIIYSFKTEHWNLISYILTSILLSYPKPLVKPSTD